MLVPVSWLAEYVDLPEGLTSRGLADALIAAGLEVESVDEVGADVSGPLVVGRVLEYADEPQSNGKTIRWCQVDVGDPGGPRGIVCGADNFATGDVVVVALPGTTLPGGFAIGARKTYGHVSDGMICSVRELGLGEEYSGILVLRASDADASDLLPGADARRVLGLPDAVLDIAVTPDRGYCLSIRGVAREAATVLGVRFEDPGIRETPAPNADGWPVSIDDPTACDRFVTRIVRGFDAHALSPFWLRRRLHLAGMRPISVAVDVTNYVMLALGQPTHGYDRVRLSGPLVVRRGHPGEGLRTLDGVDHTIDPDDVVIADSTGAVGLAGLMGGEMTELHDGSTDIVVEAAHFDAVAISRASRRHTFVTEASRRFERGVDEDLAPAAADLVVTTIVALAGGTAEPGVTDVDLRRKRAPIMLDPAYPGRLAGLDLSPAEVTERLESVGAAVNRRPPDGGALVVTAPSWRPDLTEPADLAEEVIRLHGYESIPSVLPKVAAGRGYDLPQRHLIQVSKALAGYGLVEVTSYPFIGERKLDALGIPRDDVRRRALRLANPLSDQEPLLRTTLLPGLLDVVKRNLGRGFPDLAVYETGRVFHPRPGQDGQARPPRLPADHRPTDEQLAMLDAGLPDQPDHVAVVFTGEFDQRGWWGSGRRASWEDAVEVAKLAAEAIDAPVRVRSADVKPWHPGRCAEVLVGDPGLEEVVGWAGELHPKVCAELGLPPRTVAAEISLEPLVRYAEPLDQAPSLSTYPIATQDVALIVPADVHAADVEAALRRGAGDLLESLRLFDVYTGDQVGPGKKSLAFTLRFRAPDRTLTAEEAGIARDAAVAEAAARFGAVLRS
jgi:phenylalanyl-tRNA synthetase beta chain